MAKEDPRSVGAAGEGARPYAVRSLERGLSVLTCFDVDHPSLTLVDLTRATGLHKATCFRLIKTLEAESFLKCDAATGEYSLGVALVRLAFLARSSGVLAGVARPHLLALRDSTGESVDLCVWTGTGPLLVDRCLSARAFQPRNVVGQVITDPNTTHARIWLAAGTAAQRQRAAEVYGLARGAAGDDADVRQDRDRLSRGEPVLDIGEGRGVCAQGLPIRDASGEVVASLAVVAPYPPPESAEMDWRARSILQVATALSAELGHRE